MNGLWQMLVGQSRLPPKKLVIQCMVFSFGFVAPIIPLLNSLLNLKFMFTLPMPDRMPSDVAHWFVKEACVDGFVAAILGFVMGTSAVGLCSVASRLRELHKNERRW
jgi:hypothetical protein